MDTDNQKNFYGFDNVIKAFKSYVIKCVEGDKEIMFPYSVVKEYGDIYIRNSDIDKNYVSINDKGLIALHDDKDREIWHMEKDIVEQKPFASNLLSCFIAPFMLAAKRLELKEGIDY